MEILNLLRKLLVMRFGVTTVYFEQCSEHQQMTRLRPDQTYASVVASPHSASMQTSSPVPFGGPTPMDIDAARHRGPLSEAKKQWCRAN